MFKSPYWASLIDVKIADRLVAAMSSVRLASYGLPTASAVAVVVNPVNQAPAGALGSALAGALNGRQASATTAQSQGAAPDVHSYGNPHRGRSKARQKHDAVRGDVSSAPYVGGGDAQQHPQRFHPALRSPDWYEQTWLNANHAAMVLDAKAKLSKRNKPHDPDRVVAELAFGFWCGMFHFAYENGRRAAWPALLGSVLPGVPKSWRTRAKVQGRVEDARALRNRVFHHEPITFHQDLREKHRHLVEVLGWFSPEAREHIEQICRFNRVHDDNLSLRSPAEA